MNITLTAQPGKCFLLFLTDTVLGSASARWTACGSLQVIRKTRWLASELGGDRAMRPSAVMPVSVPGAWKEGSSGHQGRD